MGDITPTVLDWFQISYPKYRIFHHSPDTKLTGKSLLAGKKNRTEMTFGSQNLHEVTMYYPMRMARTQRFKLIRNLAFKMPFPIDQDFYISDVFQEILNNTRRKRPTHWNYSLHGY